MNTKRRLSPSEQYFEPVHSENEWVSGVTQMDDGSNSFFVGIAQFTETYLHGEHQYLINSRTQQGVTARVLKAWANTKVLESNELTYALTTLLKANCEPEALMRASVGISPDSLRHSNRIPFEPNKLGKPKLSVILKELIMAKPVELITPQAKAPSIPGNWLDGEYGRKERGNWTDSMFLFGDAATDLSPGKLVFLKSRQTGLTEFMREQISERKQVKNDLVMKPGYEIKGVHLKNSNIPKSGTRFYPVLNLAEGDYTSLDHVQWHKIQSGDPLESHNNAINNQGVNMTMTSQQLTILKKLAKVNQDADEFAHLTNTEDLGDELSKAVSALRDEERAGAIKQAAQLVLSQLDAAKVMIDSHRGQLAAIRRSEKQIIASIEYTAVAMAYGRETQNFLPLAYHLECGGSIERVPQENRVPEADFKRLLELVRAKQKATQQAAKTTKSPAKTLAVKPGKV